MRQTLRKHQRLKRKKWILSLFQKGIRRRSGSIQSYYLPWEALANHQVLFSVSKKCFKKAVHRNKIKRRMREAYRRAQGLLDRPNVPPLLLGYVYIGKDLAEATYENMKDAMRSIFHHIIHVCPLYQGGKTQPMPQKTCK